jgi:ankyrin repeat protein
MDGSSRSITVKLGGRTRTISDHDETIPKPLLELLLDVDRVSDSHRWRHGDPTKEPITRIAEDAYLPKPGVTPMMLAAARNEMDKLKVLIDAGGNVNETDASGWSVLMYAACSSSYYPIKMLLKAGANPNQSSPHGDTPLMVSCLYGNWVDILVNAGANINAQNKDGQTALMMLAALDKVDEIRDALKAGADASLKDKKGHSALDYLRLASCGKSPLYDPVMDNISGYSKCTALPEDDLRAAEKLLQDALHQMY